MSPAEAGSPNIRNLYSARLRARLRQMTPFGLGEAVVREIKSIPGMEQYGVHSLKEYLSLMSSRNGSGWQPVSRR